MKTVFVSSTFKDMHFERDAIQDITLPRLNNDAAKYSQRVSFCDLRWGVNTTNLDSDEGSKKVLDVCLDEIDRCKPLMVVILGDRYGWIPDERLITTAAERKSVKLEDYQTSVTALEIEYGALADEEKRERTLFYFREIENEAPAEYGAENAEHKAKLDALKAKIIKLTGGRIKTYKVKWNGNGFDGMDDFASMLADDLAMMLKPQWEEYAKMTPFEREIHTHKTFIAEKSKMFRARKSLADEILANIEKNPLTVIKGESGSGKSTLLSFVAQELMDHGENIQPFICGLTSESNDATDILKNIVFYFEEKLGFDHFNDEKDPMTGEKKQHSTDEWQERLDELCSDYSYKGNKVIIIVDAVDQLLANELREKLIFIPHNLDENVKFVFSCLAEFRTTGMEYIEIKPLDDNGKREVIEGTLSATGRQLADAVIAEMVKMPASDNALFLSLLIQRLTMMNRFDFDIINSGDKNDQMGEISKRQIEIIRNCPDDLNEMCVALLDEAGKRINPELVRKAAVYIAVSRHGLRPKDLESLIGENWDTVDFTHFIAYMTDSFMLRDDGRYDFTHKSIRAGFREVCGNKQQIHKEILEHFKNLPENDPVRIEEIIYHCIKADDKQYFVNYVKKYEYADDKTYINNAAKDTYDCCMEDNGKWLCDLLSEGIVFDADRKFINFINFDLYAKFRGSLAELTVQKNIFESNLNFSDVVARKQKSSKSLRDLSISYNKLGDIYCAFGDIENLENALKLYKKDLKISKQLACEQKTSKSLRDLSVSYENLGNTYSALGGRENLAKALEFYEKGFEIRARIVCEQKTSESLRDLSISYSNLGDTYCSLGGRENLGKALELYEKDLEISEQLACEQKTAESLRDMSVSYERLGDICRTLGFLEDLKSFVCKEFLEKALDFYDKGLKIREQIAHEEKTPESLRELSISYNKLGRIYEHLDSIENFENLEKIQERYKTDDAYTSLRGREKLIKTIELYEKGLKIREQLAREEKTPESLRELSISYNNLGDIYKNLNGRENLEKALELYEKGLRIREQLVCELNTVDSYDDLSISYRNLGIHPLVPSEKRREYLQKAIEIVEMLYECTQTTRYESLVKLYEFDLEEDQCRSQLQPSEKKGLFGFFKKKRKNKNI